ncbi:MAG: tRNA (adenosine(37)-N6)-threonylcarbamoyltransferase complex dimerization subunit type 1 TsaB [Candidatus Omnitrophica bacterium]|nr:tRNA (adenosine(37)-N6)-threonylcarbamoyltransferase complex dimerization subunit type 1 TsaB [Candidatus Omnitrophota bacterium]
MNILAIDTSTSYLSLAVGKDNKVLNSSNVLLEKVLSSSIIDRIDKILKKSRLTLSKIDGFAVGLGPGSFTSLRIGLSTIKAFAFSLDKPIVGIPSLDLIAQNVAQPKNEGMQICVLSDARRSLVYSCLYQVNGRGLKSVMPYHLSPLEDVLSRIKGDVMFVGDGALLYKEQIKKVLSPQQITFANERQSRPEAKNLLLLACDRFSKSKIDDVRKLFPLYLYPEDCQVDKKSLSQKLGRKI